MSVVPQGRIQKHTLGQRSGCLYVVHSSLQVFVSILHISVSSQRTSILTKRSERRLPMHATLSSRNQVQASINGFHLTCTGIGYRGPACPFFLHLIPSPTPIQISFSMEVCLLGHMYPKGCASAHSEGCKGSLSMCVVFCGAQQGCHRGVRLRGSRH